MISKETIETCLILLDQISVKLTDPEGEDLWNKGLKAVRELRNELELCNIRTSELQQQNGKDSTSDTLPSYEIRTTAQM